MKQELLPQFYIPSHKETFTKQMPPGKLEFMIDYNANVSAVYNLFMPYFFQGPRTLSLQLK